MIRITSQKSRSIMYDFPYGQCFLSAGMSRIPGQIGRFQISALVGEKTYVLAAYSSLERAKLELTNLLRWADRRPDPSNWVYRFPEEKEETEEA